MIVSTRLTTSPSTLLPFAGIPGACGRCGRKESRRYLSARAGAAPQAQEEGDPRVAQRPRSGRRRLRQDVEDEEGNLQQEAGAREGGDHEGRREEEEVATIPEGHKRPTGQANNPGLSDHKRRRAHFISS